MADEGTNDIDKGTQQGDPKSDAADTQKQANASEGGKGPSPEFVASLGELDTDTSEWLAKREDIKDGKSLAKIARDKDKMVGELSTRLQSAIVPPGKDAKPEEVAAYREKMGIGNSADDYVFEVPKDLPDNLPYDGERAKSFAALANAEGLTKKQAQAVHDWAVKNGVDDFANAGKAETERQLGVAKAETQKLEKLYGPVTGEQFKANAAFADRALQLGGEEVVADLMDAGLVVEIDGVKVPQRASVFNLFAKVGQSLFKEGEVIRGNPSSLNNPFMDGEQENITEQGRMLKSDKPRALQLIAAAGKKPADFGLQG